MVVTDSLWAALLCGSVDFFLHVKGSDVVDILFHKRLRQLVYDCRISPDCAGGEDIALGFYVLAGGGLECHARLFPIPLHLVQFLCHGLHGFFLGGLVVEYDGVGLAFVHFAYPVGAGWQFFNLHGIILLKNGYKNNSQPEHEFRLQAVLVNGTIFL